MEGSNDDEKDWRDQLKKGIIVQNLSDFTDRRNVMMQVIKCNLREKCMALKDLMW